MRRVLRLGLLLAGAALLPAPAGARSAGFQILIDTNQLQPDEALQARRFAADGVWSIPENSPQGIDWPRTLMALNAAGWSVSEDNPGATSQVDQVSAATHRMVDGAMFYNEDGMATPLSDQQIAAYAAHLVPGLGPVGARIVLLTRSFGDSDPRQAQLKHALANPDVSGATFEFNPDTIEEPSNFGTGCRYILSQHKACYLLMAPKAGTPDYLGDVQKSIHYFEQTKGLLDDPNVFVVLATYGRPGTVHYLSLGSTDRDSIEAAVAWLQAYRAGRLHPPH